MKTIIFPGTPQRKDNAIFFGRERTRELLAAYQNVTGEVHPPKQPNRAKIPNHPEMEVASAWNQLGHTEQIEAAMIMSRQQGRVDIDIRLLALLLRIDHNILRRYTFYNVLTAEEITELCLLTYFFFEAGPIIYLPDTKLYKAPAMSFIEFVRLDEGLRALAQNDYIPEQKILDIIAIRYHYQGQRYSDDPYMVVEKKAILSKINKELAANTFRQIEAEYIDLIGKFPVLFPKKPPTAEPTPKVQAHSQTKAWFEFIRFLAKHPTKFEDTAHLPATQILYELEDWVKVNVKKTSPSVPRERGK